LVAIRFSFTASGFAGWIFLFPCVDPFCLKCTVFPLDFLKQVAGPFSPAAFLLIFSLHAAKDLLPFPISSSSDPLSPGVIFSRSALPVRSPGTAWDFSPATGRACGFVSVPSCCRQGAIPSPVCGSRHSPPVGGAASLGALNPTRFSSWSAPCVPSTGLSVDWFCC
jgi:hypothetical protein